MDHRGIDQASLGYHSGIAGGSLRETAARTSPCPLLFHQSRTWPPRLPPFRAPAPPLVLRPVDLLLPRPADESAIATGDAGGTRMPEITPGPGPDQPAHSTELEPWRPRPHGTPYPVQTDLAPEPPAPWETGRVTDEGRLPGTRRLWLAGGLAVAVLIATATAISLQDNGSDDSSQNRANETTSDTGLLFPPGASAGTSGSTLAPAGKNALASPQSSPPPPPRGVRPHPSPRDRVPTPSPPPDSRSPPRPASPPPPRRLPR